MQPESELGTKEWWSQDLVGSASTFHPFSLGMVRKDFPLHGGFQGSEIISVTVNKNMEESMKILSVWWGVPWSFIPT